jgi:hypothetical protein
VDGETLTGIVKSTQLRWMLPLWQLLADPHDCDADRLGQLLSVGNRPSAPSLIIQLENESAGVGGTFRAGADGALLVYPRFVA